jgi:hypothetical protein
MPLYVDPKKSPAWAKKAIGAEAKQAPQATQEARSDAGAQKAQRARGTRTSPPEKPDGSSVIIAGGEWHYEYRVTHGHRWYRGERDTGWHADLYAACARVRAMEGR